MKESAIEKRFVQDLKALGCLAYKFVSPGNDGVPDRIVITPSGKVHFVELKTEAGKLSPVQKVQLERLKERKASVRVLYGVKDVVAFEEEVKHEV